MIIKLNPQVCYIGRVKGLYSFIQDLTWHWLCSRRDVVLTMRPRIHGDSFLSHPDLSIEDEGPINDLLLTLFNLKDPPTDPPIPCPVVTVGPTGQLDVQLSEVPRQTDTGGS